MVELPPKTDSCSSSSMDTEGSKEKKNDKDAMEEDCTLVTEALQQIVGLDETVKSSRAVSSCTDEMAHRVIEKWREQWRRREVSEWIKTK